MADPHQIYSLIANAISECSRYNSAGMVQPEEAKVMAKSIVEQLGDAGLQIVVSRPSKELGSKTFHGLEP